MRSDKIEKLGKALLILSLLAFATVTAYIVVQGLADSRNASQFE